MPAWALHNGASSAAGTPQFPYICNRWFYGSPTGGSGLSETASLDNVNHASGEVTLSWTSVEGGSFQLNASTDLSTWTTLAQAQPATSNATRTSVVESNAANDSRRFYQVGRSALATYDGGGGIPYSAPSANTKAASSVGSSTSVTTSLTGLAADCDSHFQPPRRCHDGSLHLERHFWPQHVVQNRRLHHQLS